MRLSVPSAPEAVSAGAALAICAPFLMGDWMTTCSVPFPLVSFFALGFFGGAFGFPVSFFVVDFPFRPAVVLLSEDGTTECSGPASGPAIDDPMNTGDGAGGGGIRRASRLACIVSRSSCLDVLVSGAGPGGCFRLGWGRGLAAGGGGMTLGALVCGDDGFGKLLGGGGSEGGRGILELNSGIVLASDSAMETSPGSGWTSFRRFTGRGFGRALDFATTEGPIMSSSSDDSSMTPSKYDGGFLEAILERLFVRSAMSSEKSKGTEVMSSRAVGGAEVVSTMTVGCGGGSGGVCMTEVGSLVGAVASELALAALFLNAGRGRGRDGAGFEDDIDVSAMMGV